MSRVAVLCLLATGLSVVAPPAEASCAEDAGPSGSEVIFLGTAQEERRGFTRFEVDEVWAGPDLAPEVWVLSGQRQPPWPLSAFSAVSSSVDAEFETGEEYVVGTNSAFSTGACSVSGPDASEALRPDEPRDPTESGARGADPPIGPLGQAGVVTGGLAALGVPLLLRRRRRARRGSESQGR